ncbi:PEP/pyruvate-binding domain-containing protein [[Limnothrix rosea] IAM M-220]|uniref:PEP/pyruvate-binding domain-containing protein n=1 Tax=[Limnothrix rosea] IAM M-220 TaxID=454133 RepID=UPI00095E9600|nr:PEP/pyruvate-binding domain-containing protein [[Limnothrix rosea] IAM M-220]OKH12520.1 hypothetical protein NIES208_15980 [[Limnothrix rosea] IAM M-220]
MKLTWLDDIQINQTEVGGKALAIAQLRQANFSIPNGFVLSDLEFISCQKLVADNIHSQEEKTNHSLDLQLSINNQAVIQKAIATLCPNNELLAVRSSAIGEDSNIASFAGQFKSILNVRVENIEAEILKVWQSASDNTVKSYRQTKHLQIQPMAILIQPMIAAEIAGVAFSRDPISAEQNIIINAVRGLGDRLMAGDITGQNYVINRLNNIIESPQESPILDNKKILEITSLVRQIEQYFGQPQDIEWAIAANQLYLLQARPITTLHNLLEVDGIFQLWDNSNIIESYSGITTPLTFSFARKAYTEVYQQFCFFMGVSPQKISQKRTVFQNMIGFIQGRIYYNLLNWYRVLAMLPALKLNAGFMEQMMGVKEELPKNFIKEIQAEAEIKNWGDRRQSFQTILVLFFNFFTLESRIKKYYQRIETVVTPTKNLTPPIDMNLWRADELVNHYRTVEEKLLAHWDAPLINDFFAMIFYGLLRTTTEKWCGDQTNSLHNALIASTENVVSAEPLKLMHEMAAELQALDIEILAKGSLKEIQQWLKKQPEFTLKYQVYLEKFGDRCLGELKLESPTLRDQPLSLFRSIAQLAQIPNIKNTSNKSMQVEAEVTAFSTLKNNIFKRFIFYWILKNTRRLIRNRENLRFERTKVFGLARRIFMQLGKRLSQINRLNSDEDIFYLEVEEIMGFVSGTATCQNLQGLVDLRRQEYQMYQQTSVPGDRFSTRGIVYQGNQFQASAPAEMPTSNLYQQGKSCAVGRAQGEVRIVKNPQQFLQQCSHNAGAGYILVAESTDPGWVLLFPHAAGLLVERGSVLSHVAIVCRELGLPMITDLVGITQWLHDGDRVEIDGATGKIYKLETEAIAPSNVSRKYV